METAPKTEKENLKIKTKRSTSKQKIKNLEAEVKQLKNKYLLALADTENLRKRFIKEKDLIELKSTEKVLQPFLTIYQHFQMAVQAMQHDATVESVKQGLAIISNSFNIIFQNLNLEIIDAINKQFDPTIHNAVSREYSDNIPQGTVITQWTPGFKWNGKLLKPASVIVSMGKK